MTPSLSSLLPILAAIPGVSIPASFLQSVSIAATQRKIEQLEQMLRAEVAQLNEQIRTGQLLIDTEYVASDAFAANVMQALRAAELAETDTKLRFVARALAGCALSFPRPRLDKFQTLRIIEGLSDRELRVFAGLYDLLDPMDPYADTIPAGGALTLAGLTRQEFLAALLGLEQLGLLSKETQTTQDEWSTAGPGWKLTPLARQVALLGRVGPGEL
jgi:septum formation inhibitor MinC